MDSKKIEQFIVPIMILIGLAIAVGLLAPKLVASIQSYQSVASEITTKESTLKEKQDTLNAMKEREANQQKEEQAAAANEKPFYKPIMEGLDTEAVIAGEFNEILQLVRANKIKIRAMKTIPDPSDDVFVQNAADKYNAATVSMEMIANYTNFDNFLKELYKHEHFLNIDTVEIVPYKKDKTILLINCKLRLYAKK